MTFYLAKLPIARRLFLTFSLAAVIPDLIIVMMISIYTHALIVNGVGPVQTGPLLLAAVIALLCSTGAVIALGFLMYLTITRPLLHLVDLTQRIEKDDTTARAHLTGHDEIGIVATSMNSMLDHIVRLIQETQGQRDRLQAQVEQLVNEVSGVGEGDLRIQAEVTHAELGVLADSFNYMVEELSSLVIRVKQVAREVEVSTMQTSDRMAQLMESASVQIAQMTEAALEVERMAHASQQVSQRAQQLAHMAETARETARVGGASTRQTIRGMGRVTQNVQTTAQKVHVLESRSEEINAISAVMSTLAHSTNRLSLDAAIQAAMAGESGKGFADILPQRVNRERVDKAVTFFLRCIVEELWTLPGAKEIREIYNLQFQKIQADTAKQQVALAVAQLQATTQLSIDMRQALFQLATKLDEYLLSLPQPQSTLQRIRPYHNLPQPDYRTFIGRHEELDWLRLRLSPSDRVWQMVITGIGGVGKSSLALVIADDYRQHYEELASEERFEAIIWISAKEEILTIEGREKSVLSGLTFRTLEDMYTTIAQTLEREDITRALSPQEQTLLVRRVLSAQRTLLIIDNLESVADERVKIFLRSLPLPTKCIITSREWVDVADVLKLMGLPFEEAKKLIAEEVKTRGVTLNSEEEQRLIERTAGLPLPIKLSIARMVSGETFDQVMRWLGNATGDLPEYCVKGQIDIAYQRNSNAERLLLACSLFDREIGASREALGYIANLSLIDRDDALTLLQRLSLITPINDDRFSMLPMIQAYTGVKLAITDDGKALTQNWLGWLLEFSQHYGIDLEFHIERTQTVATEYLHMLKAIRWCREYEQWEMLRELVEGLWFYSYLVGLFGELREILEAAVQASKALQDQRGEGRWLYRLGLLFWVQGQHHKAQAECLERAEEIAQQQKDDYILAQIYYISSNILAHQGHIGEAERQAVTILEIGEKLDNLELKYQAASCLVECKSKEQQFDKALEWVDQGEKWCRELDWKRGLAWSMYRRGTILIQQGKDIMAEPFLVQSLDMAVSWSDRRLMACNKYRLMQVYANTGQIGLVHQVAEEAHDLCERLGMSLKLAEIEELLRKLPGKYCN